jgi:hypothetical protein
MQSINKEYKKINLRDFRHNFTQLKDSLADGEIYQVVEKGNSLGFFIPSAYNVEVKNAEEDKTNEFVKYFLSVRGSFSLNDEAKELAKVYGNDYKKIYHKLLEKKYSKKGIK